MITNVPMESLSTSLQPLTLEEIENIGLTINQYALLIYVYTKGKAQYNYTWIKSNIGIKVYSRKLIQDINKLIELEYISLEQSPNKTWIVPTKELISTELQGRLNPEEVRVVGHIHTHKDKVCNCTREQLRLKFKSRVDCIDFLIEGRILERTLKGNITFFQSIKTQTSKLLLSLELAKILGISNTELNHSICKIKLEAQPFTHYYRYRPYKCFYLSKEEVNTILQSKRLSIDSLPFNSRKTLYEKFYP
jgi:hypothetical protein